MKNTKLIYLNLLIVIFILGCENSTSNENNIISGLVVYNNSTTPVNDADIYIYLNAKAIGMSTYFYSHTISTNIHGEYSFQYSTDYRYNLYSELIQDGLVSHCGPSVYVHTSEELVPIVADDIELYENQTQSTIILSFESFINGVDTDSMKVHLSRRVGVDYVVIDSLITDESTSFNFDNMETGLYSVSTEKTTFVPGIGITQIHTCNGIPFVDGVSVVEATIPIEFSQCEKPAIYIYPQIEENYNVNLLFKDGVSLTKSIPLYNNGWDVFVDKKGKINNRYDYLFYECSLATNFKFQKGYCYSSDDINSGIKQILSEIGLNEKEIRDFVDYWGNRFEKYPFYKVYPVVDNEIDNFVELQISPKPDSILRVWLYFEGCNSNQKLEHPLFKKFERRNSVVVEWGGVMIN